MRKNLKNIFLVSALSLGLIVGAVGVVSAATSTDYQQKIAGWIKNDPNPVALDTNSGAASVNTPSATPVVNPATAPVATQTPAPVAAPVNKPVSAPAVAPAPAAPPVKTVTSAPVTQGQSNQYHYNDGHSNMNPQQHQQTHNSVNENCNNISGNHRSGSGHE